MGVASKRTVTKTRRKTRDLDQIKADLASAKHLGRFKEAKATDELPGLGQNYCIECAKWFDTNSALLAHTRGKPHNLKQLRDEADTARLPGGRYTPPLRNAIGEPHLEPNASEDVKMAA
ncbi:zinc finger containing protein [Cordyceps javanica]|nr:zinc finger containing protein [Cordyceps javanica]